MPLSAREHAHAPTSCRMRRFGTRKCEYAPVFKGPGRLIALVASVLVLVVAATVAYLLLPPRQTSNVAVPAPNATPEQVVTAYLDALNAHDCGTAEAVTTEGAKDSAKSWCTDVASLSAVHVRDQFAERPKWSGRSPSEQVSDVPVTFDLNWRLFHNDASMDEGATTWATSWCATRRTRLGASSTEVLAEGPPGHAAIRACARDRC